MCQLTLVLALVLRHTQATPLLISTVGHGLNSAPELIFVKARGVTQNWVTYHSALGVDKTLYLNGTDAEISNTGYWGTVNASTWGAKSGGFSNNLSTTMLAYAFHSVDGYSKVGSYTGNGSTDGPFVHCGFRPAYVMIKQSSGTGSWVLIRYYTFMLLTS